MKIYEKLFTQKFNSLIFPHFFPNIYFTHFRVVLVLSHISCQSSWMEHINRPRPQAKSTGVQQSPPVRKQVLAKPKRVQVLRLSSCSTNYDAISHLRCPSPHPSSPSPSLHTIHIYIYILTLPKRLYFWNATVTTEKQMLWKVFFGKVNNCPKRQSL